MNGWQRDAMINAGGEWLVVWCAKGGKKRRGVTDRSVVWYKIAKHAGISTLTE